MKVEQLYSGSRRIDSLKTKLVRIQLELKLYYPLNRVPTHLVNEVEELLQLFNELDKRIDSFLGQELP